MKTSRTAALSEVDRKNGRFVRIDQIRQLQEGKPLAVYLRAIEPRVLLVKQVFTNADGSQGTLYLIATDLEMSYEQITTIYQKR